jgi:biotin transport system substrate-specific component
MLRTIPHTRDLPQLQRLAGIALFTLITIFAARVTIEIGLVPFTLQPLAVLLSGMVLGGRDGFLSQLAYVSLIAVGLPVDARGLGAAAFAGPTAGYLVGFVLAAGAAGYLVERGAKRVWQRWLAGVVGIAIIYACGLAWLMAFRQLDVAAAWAAGVAPFIAPDLVKALIAASLTEGARSLLLRRSL